MGAPGQELQGGNPEQHFLNLEGVFTELYVAMETFALQLRYHP